MVEYEQVLEWLSDPCFIVIANSDFTILFKFPSENSCYQLLNDKVSKLCAVKRKERFVSENFYNLLRGKNGLIARKNSFFFYEYLPDIKSS